MSNFNTQKTSNDFVAEAVRDVTPSSGIAIELYYLHWKVEAPRLLWKLWISAGNLCNAGYIPIVTARLERFTQTVKRPTRKLTELEEVKLRECILAGPKTQDADCSLRGKDARRIINEQFDMQYSLPGVYVLLHRLGLSYLVPRHKKNDPEKMRQWLKEIPLLSKESDKKERTKQ
jgi:transposase